MLTLTMKPGDYIVIGEDIVIQATKVDTGVHLNIEAPRNIPIQRAVHYEKDHPIPVCITRGQKNWPLVGRR